MCCNGCSIVFAPTLECSVLNDFREDLSDAASDFTAANIDLYVPSTVRLLVLSALRNTHIDFTSQEDARYTVVIGHIATHPNPDPNPTPTIIGQSTLQLQPAGGASSKPLEVSSFLLRMLSVV